jgi:hypothetical protein
MDSLYLAIDQIPATLSHVCDDISNTSGWWDQKVQTHWDADCKYHMSEHYNLTPESVEDEDPCLIYYDGEEKQVCARCRYGAVRIVTLNGIYCGYS